MAAGRWGLPDLRRWTPLTFLFPSRYVEDDAFWADFDFETWSDSEYRWIRDPWNGFRDFARRPRETVARKRGDCEDYALVAVSWAVANGRDGVGLAFCWKWPYPWPTHVVAFDDGRVYSSGDVREQRVSEWVEESTYRFALERRVR
jgi:hypothetical protein